jgi:hypothetical protein
MLTEANPVNIHEAPATPAPRVEHGARIGDGTMGKIYIGKSIHVKTRRELLASVKPSMRQHLRPDTGVMPEGQRPPPSSKPTLIPLLPQAV